MSKNKTKPLRNLIVSLSKRPLEFYLINMVITYLGGFLIATILLNYDYKLYSIKVAIIIATALLFFWGGWKLTGKIKIIQLTYNECKLSAYFFSLIFLFSLLYIFKDNPAPLLSNLLGSDMTSSELRALATKGKSGFDSIINGMAFASSYIGIGLLSIYFFHKNAKLKWIILAVATFFLLLNGQKSRFIIVFIPIIIILIHQNKFKQLKTSMILGAITLFLVMTVYGFSDFEKINENIKYQDTQTRLTEGGRDLFSTQTTSNFVIHRKFWIPFITAIDWLRYKEQYLPDQLLLGASIPGVSSIFGMERINLDNEVFKFQFNASSSSLGAANTFFAFDALINFGWIGVIGISIISGSIFVIIWKGLAYPFNIIIFVWLYSYQSSSLQALLLGGGMFIPLILILIKNILRR